MDGLIECLKECNIKLDALRTAEYRFVAWIIYSTKHSCFVAGVDTYGNDEQNLQLVATKAVNDSPIGVMNQIYRQILRWEEVGYILLNHPVFDP